MINSVASLFRGPLLPDFCRRELSYFVCRARFRYNFTLIRIGGHVKPVFSIADQFSGVMHRGGRWHSNRDGANFGGSGYSKGHRNYSGDQERTHDLKDGGRGGRGRGRPPPGLRGKEIGLYYASISRRKKQERETRERPVIKINRNHRESIESVLASREGSCPAASGHSATGSGLQTPDVIIDEPNEESQSSSPGNIPRKVYLSRSPNVDQTLRDELNSSRRSNLGYKTMLEFRQQLPVYNSKEEILSAIKANQVVLISGETGCGKTTQVPQFIMEDAIDQNKGSICHVICTQPRRISATSVAERVAAERGEDCGGQSCGYQIRLESAMPRPHGSILYCTTGVLLRRLIEDPLLQCASHIILDEVHERDLLSDFMLIIAKDILPLRKDLKLILMSATLNAEIFSTYFYNCPGLNIPGKTFPVKEMYLEDAVEMIGYEPTETNKGFTPRRRLHGKLGRMIREKELEGEMEKEQMLGTLHGKYRSSTLDAIWKMDLSDIDFDLVTGLIKHICLHKEHGAILVFLPGWEKISKLHDMLTQSTFFSKSQFVIIPLHSMMPTTNQRQVFDRPPPGKRKIIIATNIAETSITIDDVVYVIDCGQCREKGYDPELHMTCLNSVPISKASAKQRAGRAGRVQPGECFHLFTKYQQRKLKDFQLPEMLRTPLEELCLQVKILKLGRIEEFLMKSIQPPDRGSIKNSIASLQQLNALDKDEELTPLGYHLASLPIDANIGKMILFGAIFSCLDPVLTIASSLGFKSPFVTPLHKEKEVQAAKLHLANNELSDHLLLYNAFQGATLVFRNMTNFDDHQDVHIVVNGVYLCGSSGDKPFPGWEKAKRHSTRTEQDYCWDNFLSPSTLNMIKNMKRQFAQLLHGIGFIRTREPTDKAANAQSHNTKLVKAILCAGLYPNVIQVQHAASGRRPPKLLTLQGKVAMHPGSVNCDVAKFRSKWLVYHKKMKTTKVFVYDTSMVSPFSLLFFGGRVSTGTESGYDIIMVDNWVKFHASDHVADLVEKLKGELNALLEVKARNPSKDLTDVRDAPLLKAIVDLITTEEINVYDR